MAENNPFFHRGPVNDPDYFFGRENEIHFVTDLLRAGQSISLSGPRRFGKTSLLFYLANPKIATANALGLDSTRWVYIDGGMLDGLDVDWFYGAVDRAMGGESDTVPYAYFVETVRTLADQNLRLVLILDEFELIAANPYFGPALFNHLRGLAAQFPLQFITISRDPLAQLTFAHHKTLSSPFFNIFAPMPLGLFSYDEATDLLTTLSARHGRSFTTDVVMFLLELAGPHPLFLQVAGYRGFAAVAHDSVLTHSSRMALCSQILTDLEPHLLYYWRNLDPEARHCLATLPLFSAGSSSPNLEKLREAGLVRPNCTETTGSSDFAYLGKVLEIFVRQHPVEGLLQNGPFLLDTRRGLASADNRPIHLTPTEFAAFKLFLERQGQVITPEEIEAALWPDEVSPDPGRARGVIKKLRAALGPAGDAIVNRRGQGWLLEATH